jgi:hypothetical protein
MKTVNNALAVIEVPNAEIAIDIAKPYAEKARIIGEASELVQIITTAFPNSDKFQTDKAIANTVVIWANFFAEDDWRIVRLALQKHIAISKWVPTVAEIREIITDITRPDLIPSDEAWALVNRWLHNTSEYDSGDVYAIFPTLIADAIEACGGKSTLWSLLRQQYGYSGKAGLDKLTFVQLYEPKYQRERQNAMLPRHVYESIRQAQSYLNNAEYDKYLNGKQYLADKKQQKEDDCRRLEENRRARLIEQLGGGDDE